MSFNFLSTTQKRDNPSKNTVILMFEYLSVDLLVDTFSANNISHTRCRQCEKENRSAGLPVTSSIKEKTLVTKKVKKVTVNSQKVPYFPIEKAAIVRSSNANRQE